MKRWTKYLAMTLLVLCCIALTAVASAEIPVGSDFSVMTEEQVKNIWTIDGEKSDSWKVTSDGLVITTRDGEMYTSSNVASNFFRQNAGDNFIVEVKINFEKPLPSALQTAGIMIGSDLDNYIRLIVVNDFGGHYLQWRAEIAGAILEAWGPDLGSATSVYLRIKKVGDVYTGYYSYDGQTYTAISGEFAQVYNNPQLYLFAFNSTYSPGSEPVDVAFQYCDITELDENGNSVVKNSVTVNNGIGSGTYNVGASVNISANEGPAGSEFVGWAGADGLVFTSGDASTKNATFTMPARNVELTAQWTFPADLPESCDFTAMSADQLKAQWTVYTKDGQHWEDSALWRLDAEKGLVITSGQADIYAGDNYCPNIFTQGGDGNWIAETRVNLNKALTENYQGVYLMAFQDSDNYVKMIYAMNGGNGCQLLFEQNGTEIRSFGLGGVGQPEAIWLRLKKVGNTYYGYASTNGVDYVAVGDGYEMVMMNPKVALTALNGRWSGAPNFDAGFEYLKIEELNDFGNLLDKDMELVYPSNEKFVTVMAKESAVMYVAAPYADAYQWYVDRQDGNGYEAIPGATNAVYNTSAVTDDNNGYTYYCKVTDADERTDSPEITLLVTPDIDLPDTGDDFNSQLWISVSVITLAGLIGIVVFNRKKRYQH